MASSEDTVSLVVWTTQDISTAARAEEMLDLLRTFGSPWLPDKLGTHEPLRGRLANGASEFLSTWVGRPESRWQTRFWRTSRALAALGHVSWQKGLDDPLSSVSLSLPLSKYLQRGAECIAVVKALFAWAEASYGNIYAKTEFYAQHTNPRPGDSLLGVRPGEMLPGVYFANVFGAELVGLFGEERLQTCPAAYKEQFDRDTWLITTAQTPDEWWTDAASTLKSAIRKHLGEWAFFDILAQDKPVTHAIFDVRARPVGVSEPALDPAALSRDVFDSIAESRRFLGDVLTHVGTLRQRLPEARLDWTPKSLARLDRIVSRKREQGADKRDVVLELAAYFGEVVRRNLDGEWAYEVRTEMPIVRLIDSRVEYPIIRAIKLVDSGDRLLDWYEFVAAGGERLLK